MRNSWLLWLLLISLSWSACTADPPDPIGGEPNPVFVTTFTADSLPVTMQAGVDDIYLFTRVDRPFEVLRMSGAFAQETCPEGNCPGNLKFDFWNSDFGNNVSSPDSLFEPGVKWTISNLSSAGELRTVSIQWVNKNGKVFRSDWYEGFQDSAFLTVTASEPWEANERGELTWKMEVFFSGWLMDSLQTADQRIEGSAVIAVGYR